MDDNINVNFNNGRCFFNGFNKINDINPKTHRAGVNYYRFNIIGCILEKLGFATKINCFVDKKPTVIFINTKSFLKWRERHSQDEYITFKAPDLIEAVPEIMEKFEKRSQKVLNFGNDFEGSIKYIIKSYNILSYEEVIAKAEKEFLNDEDKQSKINLLKETLDRSDYKHSYAMKERPEIIITLGVDPLFLEKFLGALPGIKLCGLK
ncbi:hypothetical protein [Neochlamydia sp. AcF84]|uniref:hypothetical protein n=1 Tax=Neochlamydia sp. AcF84 TaxID=2315858 RepID=UPI00140A71B7|nr:hypothetical protein [Neochlamydia sp. AcF84]